MKKTIYLLLSTLLMVMAGCGNDLLNLKNGEQKIELPVEGDLKIIKAEGNGIGIEFCLLNEDGDPATILREGENFHFRLTISNNIQKDTAMYIVSDFLRNPTLFMVYRENGKEIGKPVKLEHCLYRSDVANKLQNGRKWEMEVPWTETRVFNGPYDSKTIGFLQCFYSGLNQKPLAKGRYYTMLKQEFCLGRFLPHPESEIVCTGELILKINFEIR